MRALEFTRLLEEPMAPGDIERVRSSKPVDPKLDQALSDVQTAIENDPSLLQKFKQIVINTKQKAQQLLKNSNQGDPNTKTEIESVEVIEDAQAHTAASDYSDAIKGIIATLANQGQPTQSIQDEVLKQINALVQSEKAISFQQGDEQGEARGKANANKVLKQLSSEIRLLAQKVSGFVDLDPTVKYNSKDKKKHANAQKATEELGSGLYQLFFNKVYLQNELTEQEVVNFVKDCVAGNVLDMPKMINSKNGVIDNFVKMHKKVYDSVVEDLVNFKGAGTTGGALGPAEILLSAIGSPVATGTGGVKGDLAVKMPDGTILGVEVKAGNENKGSGARLNGTEVNDGKGALSHFKKLYKDLGLEVSSYSISPKFLIPLNQQLSKFDNTKLNQYVVGVLRALVNNYDEVLAFKDNKTDAGQKIKELIDNTIQPGNENGPIVFEAFRDLITYVQLVSYKISDGVATIMTIDTLHRSFSITDSPEEFIDQIGNRHVVAKNLSITADPQTASFHFRSSK